MSKAPQKNEESEEKILVGTYERYLHTKREKGFYSESDMIPGSFDAVISSAVLEHMRSADNVEEFFSLAKNNGTVVIHTLVCESVPNDPDWFYINYPVHCTLWTNGAMKKLFKRYGYAGCAYHLPSKMWLFFKDRKKYDFVRRIHVKISGEWTFSDDFVDYWKKPPYHDEDSLS